MTRSRALVAASLRAAINCSKLARIEATSRMTGNPLPGDYMAMLAMAKTDNRALALECEKELARRRHVGR